MSATTTHQHLLADSNGYRELCVRLGPEGMEDEQVEAYADWLAGPARFGVERWHS